MSFAGFSRFNENINKLLKSDAFKKASESEKCDLASRLLGINLWDKKFELKENNLDKPQ